MIRGFVEVSQESPALAEAEAVSAAEALGGQGVVEPTPIPNLVPVELPEVESLVRLATRLALARRCLVPVAEPDDVLSICRREGNGGESAAFRRIGRPSSGGADNAVLASGRAFKNGGGTIDLESPARRFWLGIGADGRDRLLEEVASIDRSGPARRRMPLLPFRRPVSLPPKLARAAANLARARPGSPVLDPFLGTGALLAEAGLLGSRVYGIDRDPVMVRGALRNLAHLGVTAEEVVVGDAREVEFSDPGRAFSAVLADAPYGRSSSTGGERRAELVTQVVDRWSGRLAPDGRVVLIVPSGGNALRTSLTLRYRIPVRVHKSLTREFCVFDRSPALRRS